MRSGRTSNPAHSFSRRRMLQVTTVAAVSPVSGMSALAQSYPIRPVHLIVPYGPGGDIDVIARLIGHSLTDRLGQTVIVDNKPGAGSNIGVQAAVVAPPDGYTLLMIGITNAVNATLYKELPFNFLRDITPVAGPIAIPLILVTNPSLPVRTIQEFVAYSKANPGKINIGSFGLGTVSHLAIELLKIMTGIEVIHVPYPGAAKLTTDVLSGQVQAGFSSPSSTLAHVRAGDLRALGVTSQTSVIPGVPSLATGIPGYEVNSWIGVGAPKQTPVEIVEKLNRDINAALEDSTIKVRINEFGGSSTRLAPAELATFVAAETEKWAKVVKQANVQLN